MSARLWCLYNRLTQALIEGLADSEARAFLSAIPKSEWDRWFAWSPGQKSWQPVTARAELHGTVSRKLGVAIPPPPRLDEVEAIRQLIVSNNPDEQHAAKKVISPRDIPDVEVERENEFVNRAFARYRKRLRVELECQGKKFVTYSLDVSVGGVRVEAPLPEWIVGYCTCDLVNETTNEIAELTCSVVENQDPGHRTRLEFTGLNTREHQEQLDHWLLAA